MPLPKDNGICGGWSILDWFVRDFVCYLRIQKFQDFERAVLRMQQTHGNRFLEVLKVVFTSSKTNSVFSSSTYLLLCSSANYGCCSTSSSDDLRLLLVLSSGIFFENRKGKD